MFDYPWNVRVKAPGTYAFTLRQFPAEAAIALKHIVRARVEIAGASGTAEVQAGSDAVIVKVEIPEPGDYALHTYLQRQDGQEGSAYFVDVELLD